MRILLLSFFIPIAALKILKFFIQFYNLLIPSLRNKLQSIYLSPSKPHPYDFYWKYEKYTSNRTIYCCSNNYGRKKIQSSECRIMSFKDVKSIEYWTDYEWF